MKLLMTADAVGGVWTYAAELAGALAPLGVEATVAVLGPAPSAGQRVVMPAPVVETGLPLDWLAADAADVRAAGRALADLAADRGADLVQLNSPALAAGTRFPCPVVAVAHGCVGTWWQATETGPLPTDLAWHAELMREGLVAADAVVAPSASFAAAVRRRYRLACPPFVVHNGRTPVATENRGLAPHAFTAGRLWDKAKRTALLDAAAARLAVPLRAAGPTRAPQGDEVVAPHLALVGTIDRAALAGELAERPVFVSAASFEPFGLAVLEAAQAGCALVLSGIDTFRELWDGAALFVPGDDPARWAAAIGDLVGDDAERRRLGEAAAARAARYTATATAGAMAGLFRSLAADARAAA